jgi:SOS response regulatory protein OraA/RecX
MARLRELGYMDDAAVAEGRARTLFAAGVAPRLATRRLLSQGVAAPAAKAATEAAAEGADEAALVARAVEKALRGREPRDEKERHRLLRRLVSKGHRPSLVAKALGLDEVADDDRGTDGADE